MSWSKTRARTVKTVARRSGAGPARVAVALAAAILCLPGAALAEEGGSGHYFPGSMASFIDAVPPSPTFIVRLNVLDYGGSASLSRPIPIAGLTTLGAHADSTGLGLTMLWRPPIDLGPRWSYAMSATIPYVWLGVNADVATTLPGGAPASVARSSNTDAIGDIVLMPLMLNYNVSRDFNINFRVAEYAPTGSYEVGRLSNTGKNFWTTEPTLALMYFGQKNGIEASVFTGFDFNSENNATHYQTGTQFHVDGTLAQHFPALGGLVGLGVNAYNYQQIAGDAGSGASLGAFEGSSIGVGPVASYVGKVAGLNTVWELKWIDEVQTHDRLQGSTLWFKVLSKF